MDRSAVVGISNFELTIETLMERVNSVEAHTTLCGRPNYARAKI